QIEGAGEARPALKPKRRGLQVEDLEEEAAPEAEAGEEAAGPVPERPSEAAETTPERLERPERPPAQVLPFPPVEKPAKHKRDVAALSTGLARTRAGWVSRLGGLFTGKKEIDPGLVDEIEKVLLTA